MPKYQTKPQRSWRYEKVAKAEGEQCLACKIEKGIRRGPPGARLVVEHADNNPRNWAWSNLHLSCYSHNKRFEELEVHEKISLLRSYGDQLEKEREREGLPTWRTVLKDELPYEGGSPEMIRPTGAWRGAGVTTSTSSSKLKAPNLKKNSSPAPPFTRTAASRFRGKTISSNIPRSTPLTWKTSMTTATRLSGSGQ